MESQENKEGAKTKVVAKDLAHKKKQVINLIDMKRGQNAGIALARIKLTFEELKER